MLVIGTSLGGLNALQTILSGIPATFSLPIVVVQHRHKTSDHVLASALQRTSALPIRDADDKEKVVPGRVFLAPADYHLMVAAGRFVLSVDEPVHFSRPSIDVLFESAADEYDDRVIGLLLTGANRDGASGLRKIKENGGVALVQDPETAEAPAMPRAGIEETNVDRILPLSKIAPFIVRRYGRK
ncbi:MAG TPA: chemotaxis protein CheB [Thermoanaerobaculia bacterium]|nr:chemotaxis protein CheB [Thermoanaerobaculia bacterium]